MLSLSFYLAWKYAIQGPHRKNVSTMVRLCFISIFIGSCALALVTAVMAGFEYAIYEKMKGIHADIIMQSSGNYLQPEAISAVLVQEFPSIKASSAIMLEHVLVQNSSNDSPTVALLRGIDASQERSVSSIEQKIESTVEEKNLQRAVDEKQVLIGKPLAEHLELHPGDTLTILYTDALSNPNSSRLSLDKKELIVGGIYNTGIDDFDGMVVYCSHELMTALFPETGVSMLTLSLKKDSNEQTLIHALRERFDTLSVQSWKDLYPAIVSALTLEKYVMFFILSLICLVAGINVIALLFMYITHKRGDIAILQAMGMAPGTIMQIFMLLGLILAAIACSAGLLCAYLVSLFFERYPFIKLPDVYYVSHLPMHMEPSILITVFIAVMLICLIATWLPVRQIKYINVSEILRFEG